MNKLSLNIQKTHTMTFSNMYSIRERNNNIYADVIQFDIVNKIKFLGLFINNKLNQIEYVSNKISKNIDIIKR